MSLTSKWTSYVDKWLDKLFVYCFWHHIVTHYLTIDLTNDFTNDFDMVNSVFPCNGDHYTSTVEYKWNEMEIVKTHKDDETTKQLDVIVFWYVLEIFTHTFCNIHNASACRHTTHDSAPTLAPCMCVSVCSVNAAHASVVNVEAEPQPSNFMGHRSLQKNHNATHNDCEMQESAFCECTCWEQRGLVWLSSAYFCQTKLLA